MAVQAQPSPQPLSIYTSRYNSGSAIANNILYIISGTIASSTSYTATADTLALSLNAPFSTSSIPWQELQAGFFAGEVSATATFDQNYIVMTGITDQSNQLVGVYNISSNTWVYLPSDAVANAIPQMPRTNVALSLDLISGNIVLFGGIFQSASTYSPSAELDVLNTHSSLSQWAWSSAASNAQLLPGLVQPIMVYLPSLKATLIMGGCYQITPLNGSVLQCSPFSAGYLVNTTLPVPGGAAMPISKYSMNPPYPIERLSPCTVVLADGNVFMYGGAIANGSLSDAWLLNTQSRTWTQLNMNGLPGGRAGATCELATPDQIIMVGGYDGGLSGARQFSQPQVAIINTTTWKYTVNFTPVKPTNYAKSDSVDVSIGAIVGITIGACVITGILGFVIGRVMWRRRYDQKTNRNSIFGTIRNSHSHELLVNKDNQTNNSGNSYIPITQIGNVSCASIASSSFQSDTLTRTTFPVKNTEPFLIYPYAPTLFSTSTNMSSNTLSDPSGRSNAFEMKSITTEDSNSVKEPKPSKQQAIEKGNQLPSDLADNQRVQYAKTLQHQKQYDRNLQLRSLDSTIQRMGTQDSLFGNNKFGNSEDDGVKLSTGVVALRDIDVGEEPISGSCNSLERPDVVFSHNGVDVGCGGVKPFLATRIAVDEVRTRLPEFMKRILHMRIM
ncbi:hypothetical protein BGZ49_010346 [Haplosporangium sp. Z 27]|nr:hypothetical protein BGZ49_010346 [Haplosporangium sp. Z 27]